MKIDTRGIQPYVPLIIYFVLSVALFYFLSTLEQGSNMILAVTTLLSGTLIVYTYVKQKVDKKRDVASLILQEIRYAEARIRNYLKSSSYGLYEKLLPTDNWNNNIHLFVNDLEETELDLISSFYSKCCYIDVLIEKIGEIKTSCYSKDIKKYKKTPPLEEKITLSNSNLVDRELVIKDNDTIPKIQGILFNISRSVELIYTTTIVEKLKRIANK